MPAHGAKRGADGSRGARAACTSDAIAAHNAAADGGGCVGWWGAMSCHGAVLGAQGIRGKLDSVGGLDVHADEGAAVA